MSLRKYEALELDNKVTLIHELIPLGLMHIKEELLVEVRNLADDKQVTLAVHFNNH
jgi:hypothetical protein